MSQDEERLLCSECGARSDNLAMGLSNRLKWTQVADNGANSPSITSTTWDEQHYDSGQHRVKKKKKPRRTQQPTSAAQQWPRTSGALLSAFVALMLLLSPAETEAAIKSPVTTAGLPLDEPHFDVYRVDNYTVQLGAVAFLPCIIKNLGNRSVSWIRPVDAHILTVDQDIFISDARFSAIHQKNSSTWTLQIKSVQADDAGKYECQVSTEPKLSHFVHLSVIVPKVRIFGPGDIFVKSSSSVQLKCIVSQSMVAPTYIEWRHNDNHLPVSAVSSGMATSAGSRLQTTPPENIAEGTTMSTLTILNAKTMDTGKYTCLPAQLEPASVNLHVLETDLPALMQTSGCDECDKKRLWYPILLMQYLLFGPRFRS